MPLQTTNTVLHQIMSTTLASQGWAGVVESAKSAASNFADAKYMLFALLVLLVLYINLRLARWLSASIKFDPPHHDLPDHTGHPKHHDHTH